jgi:hypothetical protein
VVVGESLGGGAAVGTSVDGTETGTSGDCSVNKVGELDTGNGEDGIAKFDQKQADEYVLYDSSGRRRKLGIYDISMVLSDRQASLS